MPLETMLDEELERVYGELKKREVGSDEYNAVLESASKLTASSNELTKTKNDRNDKIIRNVITFIGTAATVGSVWLLSSAYLKFEETGAVPPGGKKMLDVLIRNL